MRRLTYPTLLAVLSTLPLSTIAATNGHGDLADRNRHLSMDHRIGQDTPPATADRSPRATDGAMK